MSCVGPSAKAAVMSHNGLEILGSHHRTHTIVCGYVATITNDGGIANMVLAGRPYGEHAALPSQV